MQAQSVFSVSNSRHVDDKPSNKPGDMDMSESLCFKDLTREHLVFEIISRCSHFYSSVALS